MRWLALLAWTALALGACGSRDESRLYRAPAEARAAWVLEPPVVAAGEVATLDLAVVTAPGASLRPFELPAGVDGFFVLDREPVEVVKEPARWIHHTRLRLRAIEVGRFEVPGGSLELEAPEGGAVALSYEPLPVEVVSVLAGEGRQSPYGIRLLAGRPDAGAGTLGAFAAGVLVTLSSVALLLLVRRRLAQSPEPGPDEAGPGPRPWEIARDDLARARALADDDPRRALDGASVALRRYAVRRFGGDADVRTTEELSLAQPPFTLTTRWPGFLSLLTALDAARFPPPPVGRDRAHADRARELLDRVQAFVDETAPREPGA